MSPITAHVLDTALGRPAAGITVRLDGPGAGGELVNLASAVTDSDGRVRELLTPGALRAGCYRMTFETEPYLLAQGRPVFYPRVEVLFQVQHVHEHYHIPLLLSPFGYSTYRGS